MRAILVLSILVIPVFALAQEDSIKAGGVPSSLSENAPLAAFAESLGDAPGVHPCVKLQTMRLRAGRARLARVPKAQAKARLGALAHDANADAAVNVMYAGPQPKSMDEVESRNVDEVIKCGNKYGLTVKK